MSILLKAAAYRFNLNPNSNSRDIPHIYRKIILKFIEKQKKKSKPCGVKPSLKKKNTSGDVATPDFKLYFRTTVIKTAWYLYKNRYVD